MNTRHKVAIIGTGEVAKHLANRILALGWDIVFQFNRREYLYLGGGYGWDGPETAEFRAMHFIKRRPLPELVFIAISTRDDGQEARAYVEAFTGAGIPVVTCEKGALSHFDLRSYLPRMGYTAAVGGGTQMLRYLAERRPNGHPVDIDGVFNGTLNYVFHQVAGGATLAGACAEAKALKITEPGADDPLSIINGELRDVVMKACVLHNSTLGKEALLTPDAFGKVALDEETLELLAKHAGSYRMVVSMSNRSRVPSGPFFKQGWGASAGEWDIRLGFRHIHNDSEFDWLPGGVGNGICITEGKLGSGGKYTLLGPGAGLEPTTTAMLNDAHRLLGVVERERNLAANVVAAQIR